MSESTALATRQQANGVAVTRTEAGSLDETFKLAKLMADSGYFQDTKTAAQALVKIMAGRELGFGAVASLSGISIVQGRPTVGANLMAAMVKRSGRYDYKVKRMDDAGVVLVFLEKGVIIGESSFTTDDAKRAGLADKQIWKQYARNMLFARAMSNGVRWFCPDLSGGPIYTPDELDGETDSDDLPTGIAYEPTVTVEQPAHKTIDERDPWNEPTADDIAKLAQTAAGPIERPTAKMWTRWGELWQEAQALHLDVTTLSKESTTKDQLTAAGQELAARIAEAKAIIAAEQAEAAR